MYADTVSQYCVFTKHCSRDGAAILTGERIIGGWVRVDSDLTVITRVLHAVTRVITRARELVVSVHAARQVHDRGVVGTGATVAADAVDVTRIHCVKSEL